MWKAAVSLLDIANLLLRGGWFSLEGMKYPRKARARVRGSWLRLDLLDEHDVVTGLELLQAVGVFLDLPLLALFFEGEAFSDNGKHGDQATTCGTEGGLGTILLHGISP